MKGFNKCNCCFGAKVVMGIGMVEARCENCNGVGYTEIIPDEITYLESKEEHVKKIHEIKDEKVKVYPSSKIVNKRE